MQLAGDPSVSQQEELLAISAIGRLGVEQSEELRVVLIAKPRECRGVVPPNLRIGQRLILMLESVFDRWKRPARDKPFAAAPLHAPPFFPMHPEAEGDERCAH